MMVEEKAAYRWSMLVNLFLINFVFNGFVVVVMPTLFPLISSEIGLDYTQMGLIWGALPLGMLLFSLIGGVAADRLGVKKVISTALIFAALFGGLRGFADSFWTLWLLMFLMGVSYGFIVPNLTKGVAMWFGPSELSRANGILLMGAIIGSGLGMMLGVPAAKALGNWQNVMFVGGVVALALWVLWLVAARERQPTEVMAELAKVRPKVMQGLLQVFSVKEMWLFCFIELVAVGSLIALIGIIPSFMVEKGMSPIQAGIFVSLITWTNLIGTLLGSWLSDRIGLRKVFIWPFLFANIPLLFLIPILWGWSLYLVWCLSGIMVGFAMPQLRSVIMEIKEIGPALSGSAFGGIFTFNRIGGFLMPWFTGLVMEAISAAAGVFLIASVTLIPPILVLYARETGHRVTGTTKIHSH